MTIHTMRDAQGTTRIVHPEKCTVRFGAGGDVSFDLDCNRSTGSWRLEFHRIRADCSETHTEPAAVPRRKTAVRKVADGDGYEYLPMKPLCNADFMYPPKEKKSSRPRRAFRISWSTSPGRFLRQPPWRSAGHGRLVAMAPAGWPQPGRLAAAGSSRPLTGHVGSFLPRQLPSDALVEFVGRWRRC